MLSYSLSKNLQTLKTFYIMQEGPHEFFEKGIEGQHGRVYSGLQCEGGPWAELRGYRRFQNISKTSMKIAINFMTNFSIFEVYWKFGWVQRFFKNVKTNFPRSFG